MFQTKVLEKIKTHILCLDRIPLNLLFEDFSKRKTAEKIQVSSKFDKSTLLEDLCALLIISLSVLLRMRNISDKSFRENQNTHFVFGQNSFKFVI
jgi:hypothetical protein